MSIWHRLTKVVMALLVVAGVLGIAVWYEPVIEENQHMLQQRLELDKKIALETVIAKQLDSQLHSFEDPTLQRTIVERLARERLSYARPGENVIHFDPAAGASR